MLLTKPGNPGYDYHEAVTLCAKELSGPLGRDCLLTRTDHQGAGFMVAIQSAKQYGILGVCDSVKAGRR